MNTRYFAVSMLRRMVRPRVLTAWVAILLVGFGIVLCGGAALANERTGKVTAVAREAAAASGLPRLVGSWHVTITPDDGSPSFVGFYTFNADGTASFSSAGPPNPALGNPGYGVWRQLGSGDFASTVFQNTYTTDFRFDGQLKIMSRIRVTGRDSFSTQDTVKIYAPDGSEIVTLGGGAAGTRMVVELAH
jgi:hypothetical protein